MASGQSADSGTFEPVAGSGGGSPFFKFDTVGKKIKGKVIGRRTIDSSMSATGKQDVVDLLTTDGEYTVALLTDLRSKFAQINDGDLVSIEYTGTKKGKAGRSPMKVFNVLKARAA